MKKRQTNRTSGSMLFTIIGLSVALSLTLSAFEYRDYYSTVSEIKLNDPIVLDVNETTFVVEKENKQITKKAENQAQDNTQDLKDIFELVDKLDSNKTIVVDNKDKDPCKDCDDNKNPFSGQKHDDGPETGETVDIVEEWPTFKECEHLTDNDERKACFEEHLFEHLSTNIIYPGPAKDVGIQGKVYIEFIIDSNGDVGSFKILRDIGGGCGDEGVRVLQMLPQLIPGKNSGRPVNLRYRLPINFKLGGN